jgi:hypothetical protein
MTKRQKMKALRAISTSGFLAEKDEKNMQAG